jgi:hypothetical protein
MRGGNAPSQGRNPASRDLRTHALRAIAKAITKRIGRKVVDAARPTAPHVSAPQWEAVIIAFNKNGKRKIVPAKNKMATADLQA